MTLPFCCSSLFWKRGYGWILSFPSYFLPVQWECYLSAAGGEGNVLNWLVLSLDGLVLPEPGKCLKLTYFPWACLWILPRLPFPAVSCSPHLGDGEDFSCLLLLSQLLESGVTFSCSLLRLGHTPWWILHQLSLPRGPHPGHWKHTCIFCPNTFWREGWSQSISPQRSPPDCFLHVGFLRWESDTSPCCQPLPSSISLSSLCEVSLDTSVTLSKTTVH